MTYQYPNVGAFYIGDGKTSFTVWSPLSKQVEVVITGETHAMTRDERGYWMATIHDVHPGTPYKFKIDNGDIFPDPASRSQPEGVHGPSQVYGDEFAWSDRHWKGLPLEEMIMYELHVGTFTHDGTFEGVAAKLAYLKSLGINAIEIMPVGQFPGGRNWGYDGVYPFAVQNTYGGPDGLKRLVDQAHESGIAVILDVVYNHQGPEGNYFESFGPYFTDKYKTFWGKAINFDDAWCDGVRHYYWQNALMWLDEFHIDGLRLDAVHAIWDLSANHFIAGLKSKVDAVQEKTGKPKVLIAEFDLNNPRYISPVERSGYGLDGQWIDEYHHALHALVTGERDGYYEDFGEGSHLRKALRDSYVYTGQYSIHRKKQFGAMPEDNHYGQFVVFAQNHDQVGNRLPGDRLSEQLSFESLKLVAAAYLLSPHVPMLFMGEEYGEKNPFQYFISHSDEQLVQAVRAGRKKEFSYFNWQGDVPDPQSEDTFAKCILSWRHEKAEQAAVLLSFYKELIAFRKARPAMQGRQRNCLRLCETTDEKVIGFERMFSGDGLLIALNFNKEPTPFSFTSASVLRKVFDSSSNEWNGPGGAKLLKDGKSIVLNPESAVIFEL